jgi:hypothetical protein
MIRFPPEKRTTTITPSPPHRPAFPNEELESRGELNADRALSLKDDTSDAVKVICYRTLLRAGHAVDLDDAAYDVKESVRPALLDRLKRQSLEALRQEEDWFSLHRIDAYEAAADRYAAETIAHVRADLADQPSRLRRESVTRLRSRYGADQVSAIEMGYNKAIDGFVRAWYILKKFGDLPLTKP